MGAPCFGFALAALFLSVCVGCGIFDPGTCQYTFGTPAPVRITAARRLASNRRFIDRSAHLRLFLGNVELLLIPKMDLSHARGRIPAHFRNAAAGLFWLPPVRVGAL